MSGIKYYSQIDMKARPTSGEHVVRLDDMIQYVSGKIKNPVRVLLESNFDGTYNAASKILIQDTAKVIVIDGVTVALGDRVLLTGQTDAAQNGIYTVTTLGTSSVEGVLTRAEDWDETADIVQAVKIPVAEGTIYHDKTFVLTTDPPYTIDTTEFQFTMEGLSFNVVHREGEFITGDGTTTEFTVIHSLGSAGIIVQVQTANSPQEVVNVMIQPVSAYQVKVTFAEPPENGEQYYIIMIG